MLVIARQVNEKIIAENELTGDRLEITLVAIRNGGTQVRIGIDAPEHIRLTRAEVAQADRITLEVTDVRVEPIQAITEADAVKVDKD